MMPAVAAIFLLLHGPDGHEIRINPDTVTSLRSGIPGQPNSLVHENTRCVVNLTDGKWIAVRETCAEIQERLDELGQER